MTTKLLVILFICLITIYEIIKNLFDKSEPITQLNYKQKDLDNLNLKLIELEKELANQEITEEDFTFQKLDIESKIKALK